MKKIKELLNKKGIKILDVGTGAGGFINTLTMLTDEFEEIIGIDTSSRAIEAANKNFKDERVKFIEMDALNMTFDDNSFDVVCLSNSLHHLEDISETISEMERVLKPNGILLFNEMFSDVEDPKQLTHVELHHFWAEVDRFNNVVHNETMKRNEIIETLNKNSSLIISEAWNMELDEDKELTEEDYEWLKRTLDYSLKRVKDSENYKYFEEKAEVLRERIMKVGFKGATQLLVIMK